MSEYVPMSKNVLMSEFVLLSECLDRNKPPKAASECEFLIKSQILKNLAKILKNDEFQNFNSILMIQMESKSPLPQVFFSVNPNEKLIQSSGKYILQKED